MERDTSRVVEEVVVPDGVCARLDAFAATVFVTCPSRAGARKAVRRGEITLDGLVVEPSRFVRAGERVARLEPTSAPPPTLELPLRVVFEDDWLAIVDKPPGLAVNGARARSVERALPHNLTPSGRPDAIRPRPVHRLDAPTGGLLLCGKTSAATIALGRSFQARAVHKRYRALAVGGLDGEGEIDAPIDGREAVTRWRVVDRTRALHGDWLTTLDLWPETGRTHQLRRHLAALGHPLLGDATYGLPGLILHGKGLFLWAVELRFPHPADGRPVHVAIEEPAKFATVRAREARRWARWHDLSASAPP